MKLDACGQSKAHLCAVAGWSGTTKLMAACVRDRLQLQQGMKQAPMYVLEHCITCNCEHCNALKKFLEHSEQETWNVQLPTKVTEHVRW